ncbi:nucleotidyltransferase [Metabacillus litoralis]|uniref:tRNA(Met) cytidine acetate ligase n=1 Tax=Metabacillus litoralis TaxID=152268 RepID=A0A5C6W2T6_9BACI|nr:nucleotidyltransferase [Metabacillus litoralis]TXC92068.1 nucleotidyltransferase [Metabacillus litoralis]
MNVLGLIVEYNPFHNGHLYHLKESVKKTNANVVIAVMSGNFLQRGEPSIISKWKRTEMALLNGVDLVIELPYVFATQKAETFANGAVSILDALHCDSLCFGSESGEINPFLQTTQFLLQHQIEYDELIKKHVQTGVSFPKALTLAFQELAGDQEILDLSLPNNILGFHYVSAIYKQKSKIKPYTVKRSSAGYHDETFTSPTIASATSIRKTLFSSESEELKIRNYVPPETLERINKYKSENTLLHNWESYFQYLKYSILTMSKEEIQSIYEVEEGLENRILKFIIQSTSFHELMEKLKSKRYTWTRLQRVCTHILTNTTKQEMKDITELSPYIRLLGMTEKGQKYLNSIKKDVPIPLISKVSSFQHPLLDIDIRASYTYNMIFQEPNRSLRLQDEYTTPPIRILRK